MPAHAVQTRMWTSARAPHRFAGPKMQSWPQSRPGLDAVPWQRGRHCGHRLPPVGPPLGASGGSEAGRAAGEAVCRLRWGRDALLGRLLGTALATTQQVLRADGLHMRVACKRCTQGALETGSMDNFTGVVATATGWPPSAKLMGPAGIHPSLQASSHQADHPPSSAATHIALQLCPCSPTKVRGVQTCCAADRCAACMRFARSRTRQRTSCMRQPHHRPEGRASRCKGPHKPTMGSVLSRNSK